MVAQCFDCPLNCPLLVDGRHRQYGGALSVVCAPAGLPVAGLRHSGLNLHTPFRGTRLEACQLPGCACD